MKKVIEQLVDDISGETIEDGGGETVVFALDGASYEIDLSEKNAKKLRDALKPYVSAGRRASSSPAPSRPSRARRQSNAAHWSAGYAVVREWAQSQGIDVSPRGRVADSVMQAYEDAHR